MAQAFYITAQGQKQGAIKGDVTQKGYEGAILGLALTHDIISPRDPTSGLPTGKRVHKPLTVTIPWGSATPMPLNALYNNESLTTVHLSFSRTTPAKLQEYNDVSFTCQKITTTFTVGGITATDDWQAHV